MQLPQACCVGRRAAIMRQNLKGEVQRANLGLAAPLKHDDGEHSVRQGQNSVAQVQASARDCQPGEAAQRGGCHLEISCIILPQGLRSTARSHHYRLACTYIAPLTWSMTVSRRFGQLQACAHQQHASLILYESQSLDVT